ncbi:MAG TPA: VWA domain-containing protein [Bacillales bacterium]|nr:VWA domain-containing protein [Bacillales bacterium]
MNKLNRNGRLLGDHFTDFARWLRQYEFLIGPREIADMFRSLESVDFANESEVRTALRTVLCSRQEEQEIFDELFERFFTGTETDKALPGSEGNGERKSNFLSDETGSVATEKEVGEPGSDGKAGNGAAKSSPDEDSVDDRKEMSFLEAVRFSAREWQHTESIRVPQEGMAQMVSAAQLLVSEMQLKPSRRYKPMVRGKRLDFRRTFRQNIQTGAHMIYPSWTGRPKREAEFVLLCDGSRSMLPHSERFLQFACALFQEAKRVESFIFSTRLRRITNHINRKRSGRMSILSDLGMEWGGGTRIGDSLERFVRDFGPRLLNGNAIVLIFSDGLETGESGRLEWAMRKIHRQANRVIWLNPLAAADDYKPEAMGMKTALPHVDFFSNAHDASSLSDLARKIGYWRDHG